MNNIAIQSKFINIYTHLVFFTLKRELKRPAYVAVWTCVTKLEISELCETKIMMFLYTKEYRKDKEPLKQGWNGIFGNSGVRHFQTRSLTKILIYSLKALSKTASVVLWKQC